MTRIGKIRRVNFNKVKYGKGLDNLLPRAIKRHNQKAISSLRQQYPCKTR